MTSSAYEQSDGSFAISMTSPNRGPAVDANIDEVYDACWELHLKGVETAYLGTIWPSAEEADRIMKDCLLDLGLIEPEMSDEEVDRAVGLGSDDPELAHSIGECLSKPSLQPPAGQ